MNKQVRYNICNNNFHLLSAPSQAPVNLQLFKTSCTSLKAVWGPVPECCRHGIIEFRLTLKDNTSKAIVRDETGGFDIGGEYEFEFSALLKGYAYSLSVLAFTRKGEGPSSEQVSAMTEEQGKGKVASTFQSQARKENFDSFSAFFYLPF